MAMSSPTICPKCKGRYRGKYCPRCSNWNRLLDGVATSPWQRIAGEPELRRRWLGLKKQTKVLFGGCCAECGQAEATHVDHIEGTDYMNDSGTGNSWLHIGMVQLLCARCHGRKTGRQGAEAKKTRQW